MPGQVHPHANQSALPAFAGVILLAPTPASRCASSLSFEHIRNEIREHIQDDGKGCREQYGNKGIALGKIDHPIVQLFVQLLDFFFDERNELRGQCFGV